MEQPASVDFGADRFVPFKRTLAFIGYDFTGSTFKMQVRDRRDGGTLRADLSTVGTAAAEGVRLIYAGTDTVANHITAGRLKEVPKGMTSSTSIALSQIGIRVNKSTMTAMPFANERGNDRAFPYDMHITMGSDPDVFVRGLINVRAGVTE